MRMTQPAPTLHVALNQHELHAHLLMVNVVLPEPLINVPAVFSGVHFGVISASARTFRIQAGYSVCA